MFQSTDDLNLDEDFLSDAFDVPFQSTCNEQNKRVSDEQTGQPLKRICTKSSETSTETILSIIKPKSQGTKPIICVAPDRNRRVIQRKFPGPAGILPEQKQIDLNITALEEIDTCINKKLEPDEILCSQLTEDNFKKSPWLQMLTEWSSSNHEINLPLKYTISWIKSKAIGKKLIGQKTPFLAAIIQSIDTSSKDPMILLKDRTDEIQATLLHEVWEEYYEFLNPGSVIVLKQVGVLSTLKKHYLAITSNNLITIYSEYENEVDSETQIKITNVQQLIVSDIINIIKDVKNTYQAQKVIQKVQPLVVNTTNPYFKTSNTCVNQQNNVENNSLQNKTMQLISNIRSSSSEMRNNLNSSPKISNKSENFIQNKTLQSNETILSPNSTSTLQKQNKFIFKSKLNNLKPDPNKENSNNKIITSKINLNENDNEILTQVLEGVDTDSIFGDF